MFFFYLLNYLNSFNFIKFFGSSSFRPGPGWQILRNYYKLYYFIVKNINKNNILNNKSYEICHPGPGL